MSIETYSAYLVVSFIFILFICRLIYFLVIRKTDPIKAVIPEFRGWDSIKKKKVEELNNS